MYPNFIYSDTGTGVFAMHSSQDFYYMAEAHIHIQYEYLYIHKGTVIIENNTDKIKVKGPCFVIHKPYTLHRAYTADEHTGVYDRYVVNFKDGILKDLSEYIYNIEQIGGLRMNVIRIDEKTSDYFLRCFQDIIESNENAQYKKSILILALITDTVTRLMDEYEPERIPRHAKYIYDLLQYISENINMNLTLELLADKFFISRAKLVADFRSITGISVKKYITLMRIHTAKVMLKNGLSISQTAEACGFCDDSHFIVTFKTHTNTTPKEFLKSRYWDA